jgi:Flp pilus assembly protein TadD
LQLAGRNDDAERGAAEVASRWPEWPAAWVAQGVILESHGRADEARRALGTAQALGARTPVTGPRDLRALFLDTPSRDW